MSCFSIKIHELSEIKDISNVIRLDDETKGKMRFNRSKELLLNVLT